MKKVAGGEGSTLNLSGVAIFSGTGILLSYNLFIVMMENILDLSFSGIRAINDNGLLSFNCALLISATLLLFVQSTDLYFVAIIVSGFLVLAGTVLSQVCLWSDGANPLLFYVALGIIGFATGASQVSQFAVAACESLREYNLANYVSLGIGLSGLIIWGLGLVAQTLYTDPITNLISRGALLTLLGAAAIATLFGNILFSLVLWPLLKEQPIVGEGAYGGEPIGTIPTSQDPLCSETILHLRTATNQEANDLADSTEPFVTSPNITPKDGGWDIASAYIALMFLTLFVTLFCFPCIAPLRWNLKSATIWYMGAFQVADVIGRRLANATTQAIPLYALSAAVLARLGLIGWSLHEAYSGQSAIGRIVCISMIGLTSSYLFTILMRQGTSGLRPEIAMTASTLMLLALMIGVNAGLYACKRVIELMTITDAPM